ncbi:dihydrofolate reductase family protein [Ktedonospora formicarum]|uniref:Deaminase n=1 Tax=Ktedonospora formicarum TaxID=2778364 RepID=A0A8J3MU30_9CHLR|nr:dihydrofolate reductase family protein [Ktedonospora formicarum]GHO47785.1 deaminase [Ktedonospora formicarum]
MRKLVYYVASTLDGYIAGPAGQYDFFPAADRATDLFPYLFEEFPETLPAPARAHFEISAANKHFDTVVMGRGTYEPGLKAGLTSPYPQLRQIVISSSLSAEIDPSVEFISSDPLKKVQELKQEEGMDIWLCGGGKLAQQLLPEIDELILKLNPIVIGNGIPLFSGQFQVKKFRLVSSKTFESGVMIFQYHKL